MIRLILVFASLTIARLAIAAEDPIALELDIAKASYAEQIDMADRKLVNALNARLKGEAAGGNLDRTKEIKSQIEEFEINGTVPTSVILRTERANYESDLRTARATLKAAFEKARGEYTKMLKLDLADAVNGDLKAFMDEQAGAIKERPPVDPVRKGTIWKGTRTFTKGNAKGLTVNFELYITSRVGRTFYGYTKFTSGKGVTAHDIKGNVDNGKIDWLVLKQRAGNNPGQPHKGIITGKTMDLTFEGIGASGDKIAGTAELSCQ